MPPDAPEFTPDRFFEVLLPALLIEKQAATVDYWEVIQFHLMGDVDRSWYVDFEENPAGVYEGEAESADLTIAIDENHILPMLAGRLDVPAALADETLQIAGKEQVLERLAGLFGGTLSGMDVLYASIRK